MLSTLDQLALIFALGSTVWFFFVQSPVLLRHMQRKHFVPLQMRLTKVLFRSLWVANAVMLTTSLVRGTSLFVTLSALSALLVTTLALLLVLPRAFKAGGRAMKAAEEDNSTNEFLRDGISKASRFWHQAVVLCVLTMLGSLVCHGLV